MKTNGWIMCLVASLAFATTVQAQGPGGRGGRGGFGGGGGGLFMLAGQLDHYKLAYLHVMDGLAFGFHNLGEPMTLAEIRKVYHGPLIGNCGYTKDVANEAISAGHADLIAFGRPYISNPDLVERFEHGYPLAEPAAMSDWYTPGGEKGYTDFPAYTA